MEKIKYPTDGIEKINILIYPVRFKCENEDLAFYFDKIVKKELKEKFKVVFRNFKDPAASPVDRLTGRHLWLYDESPISSLDFSIHQNHQKIEFRFARKNNERVCELIVQLEDKEFHAFQEIIADGFESMELGRAHECKRLDMVTIKFLFLQCKAPANKKIIQKYLVRKISDMQNKDKGTGDDTGNSFLSWGEGTVFPELFFADTFMPISPFWLDSIIKYNLNDLEAHGKIEEADDGYRLVKPEKNPEFYCLTRPARDGQSVSERDIARQNYYVIYKIKEQYGKTIFIGRAIKRNELTQKEMQSFLNRQKPLLRKMREELIKNGIVPDEYQTLFLKRLAEYYMKK